MIRAGSTGLALKYVTAPGPKRFRCRAFARSLGSIPPNTSFKPDGPDSSGRWSREATCRWYHTRFTCYPSLCCALWELIVSPSCARNTFTSDCHEGLSSFARNALFLQLYGTTFTIASSDTPWMPRRSLTLLHMRRTRSELGSSFRNLSRNGPERSARTSGIVANKLLIDADIVLDSADYNPTPPAPVERLVCFFRSVASTGSPNISPQRTTIDPLFLEAREGARASTLP